jgi:hypothetical protein
MLETAIAEIRQELQAIRMEMTEIRRMVSKLPTIFQWVSIQTALIIVIFAAAFGLLRLTALH